MVIASAEFSYQDAFSFKGEKISIGARSSTNDTDSDPQNIHHLGGHLNAGLLLLNDSEGNSIKLDQTKNSFQMHPKRGQPTIPVLSLSNQNLRITYITADNRFILTDSKIAAKASMNTLDRQQRRAAFLDSLSRAHPDIPRDSLFTYLRSQRMARGVPAWMKDDSFKNSDIKVDLNETFKTYFKEWDIEANAGIRTGIFMTPYFPLRNILRGAEFSLNNNRVAIDSLKIVSGESEICAKGSVSGLRRVLLGRGNIQMDLKLYSHCVNADELLKAFAAGSSYSPESEPYAFWNTAITEIDIPASVTRIGLGAFNRCSKLEDVYIRSDKVVSTSFTSAYQAFSNCPNLQHIYVPAELVEEYKTHELWSLYADKFTAIGGVQNA